MFSYSRDDYNCASKDASNFAPSTFSAQNSSLLFLNDVFAGVVITMSAFLFAIICAIINSIIIHIFSMITYTIMICSMIIMLKRKFNIICQNL